MSNDTPRIRRTSTTFVPKPLHPHTQRILQAEADRRNPIAAIFSDNWKDPSVTDALRKRWRDEKAGLVRTRPIQESVVELVRRGHGRPEVPLGPRGGFPLPIIKPTIGERAGQAFGAANERTDQALRSVLERVFGWSPRAKVPSMEDRLVALAGQSGAPRKIRRPDPAPDIDRLLGMVKSNLADRRSRKGPVAKHSRSRKKASMNSENPFVQAYLDAFRKGVIKTAAAEPNWDREFRKYHATAFDPNSSMDRGKLEAMKEVWARHGKLTPSLVYGYKGKGSSAPAAAPLPPIGGSAPATVEIPTGSLNDAPGQASSGRQAPLVPIGASRTLRVPATPSSAPSKPAPSVRMAPIGSGTMQALVAQASSAPKAKPAPKPTAPALRRSIRRSGGRSRSTRSVEAVREGSGRRTVPRPKSAPSASPVPIGSGNVRAKTANLQEAGRTVDKVIADVVGKAERFARRNPMAVAGGGAGLALGGLSGVVDPSRDETGARRSRTKEALKRALMLGAVGAAGGHYADINGTHPLIRNIGIHTRNGLRTANEMIEKASQP